MAPLKIQRNLRYGLLLCSLFLWVACQPQRSGAPRLLPENTQTHPLSPVEMLSLRLELERNSEGWHALGVPKGRDLPAGLLVALQSDVRWPLEVKETPINAWLRATGVGGNLELLSARFGAAPSNKPRLKIVDNEGLSQLLDKRVGRLLEEGARPTLNRGRAALVVPGDTYALLGPSQASGQLPILSLFRVEEVEEETATLKRIAGVDSGRKDALLIWLGSRPTATSTPPTVEALVDGEMSLEEISTQFSDLLPEAFRTIISIDKESSLGAVFTLYLKKTKEGIEAHLSGPAIELSEVPEVFRTHAADLDELFSNKLLPDLLRAAWFCHRREWPELLFLAQELQREHPNEGALLASRALGAMGRLEEALSAAKDLLAAEDVPPLLFDSAHLMTLRLTARTEGLEAALKRTERPWKTSEGTARGALLRAQLLSRVEKYTEATLTLSEVPHAPKLLQKKMALRKQVFAVIQEEEVTDAALNQLIALSKDLSVQETARLLSLAGRHDALAKRYPRAQSRLSGAITLFLLADRPGRAAANILERLSAASASVRATEEEVEQTISAAKYFAEAGDHGASGETYMLVTRLYWQRLRMGAAANETLREIANALREAREAFSAAGEEKRVGETWSDGARVLIDRFKDFSLALDYMTAANLYARLAGDAEAVAKTEYMIAFLKGRVGVNSSEKNEVLRKDLEHHLDEAERFAKAAGARTLSKKIIELREQLKAPTSTSP